MTKDEYRAKVMRGDFDDESKSLWDDHGIGEYVDDTTHRYYYYLQTIENFFPTIEPDFIGGLADA